MQSDSLPPFSTASACSDYAAITVSRAAQRAIRL